MRTPRALVPLLLALSFTACVEVDMTVGTDGSAKGTLAWDAGSTPTEAEARKLLAADGVTIKSVEFKEIERKPAAGGDAKKVRRVVATLEAGKVTALAALPLFKPLAVSIALGEPADGKRKLTVSATDKTATTAATESTDNTIKLAFPGAVAETSAKADGNTVTWTFTTNDYYAKPSVDLSVVYAEAAAK